MTDHRAIERTERGTSVASFALTDSTGRAFRLDFTVLMDTESAIARYFGANLTTTTAVIGTESRLQYYGNFDAADEATEDLRVVGR